MLGIRYADGIASRLGAQRIAATNRAGVFPTWTGWALIVSGILAIVTTASGSTAAWA